MSQEVALIVHPEAQAGCQIAAELRKISPHWHVLVHDSVPRARATLDRLKSGDRSLAGVLVETSFGPLLERVEQEFPGASHATFESPLTAPRLREIIEGWSSEPEQFKVYGVRWATKSHALKDFLARNQAPYEWIDVDDRSGDPEVSDVARMRLPVVELGDGERMEDPSVEELAEKIGLKVHPDSKYYDFIIVGGGPAGLASAVYAASEGLKTVIVEAEAPGGQAGCSTMIENYLGFPQGLSGAELASRARQQAERFNVEILVPQTATDLQTRRSYHLVTLADGSVIAARAVLLATGVRYRRLEVPGEDALFGRGVYYGASYTEAVACSDERIAVVGGGNSAGQAVLHFAQFAKEVLLIVRGESIEETMSQYLVEKINATPNIALLPNSSIDKLIGNGRLERVLVNGEERSCTSVFVFIGADPCTDWLPDRILRDEEGYILTGLRLPRNEQGHRRALLETSSPGVFAAGDVVSGATKRIASAVGQGAAAVQIVHEYLRELRA